MNEAPVSFVRTEASVLLDLVRGLAAFLVVIGHARNFFFVDYNELPTHRLWTSVFYLVTKAGHQGVIIFVVLSGYLISGSVFRALERHTWSWPSYLTHRLVRLWVVLLPGLLLCLLIDHLALAHHLAPSLYRVGAANHMSVDVADHLTASIFLRNLFFLGVTLGPVFGSDTALWSLPYEFWYYLLFPLGLFTLTRTTPLGKRIITLALLIAVACFSHIFLALFPVWLAGSLLAVMPIPTFGPTLRAFATGIYVVIFFASAGFESRLGLVGDYGLTIATFLFLWILLSARKKATQTTRVHAIRGLARFSYTLYVVHTPLLLLLTASIVGESRWIPSPLTFLECTGVIALVMVYACIIASLTEFHTDAVRRWVENRLASLRPSPLARHSSSTAADTIRH
jgi:peptidoglycan/LPS O-acetylase OafA/YrhL